ncbi:MAG TPA: hypothetical protein IAB27_05035 [Candidatus Coprosoma intestinipullorum]|uniref:Uncharacterized protein n=1 Tax=Candidatus Coprosoma intestinipullorum TaxID=2840752 RepID=A0A9D0ZR43_9FIRM|nr:hypothetical protein [Candidatus Coprosoma intestinipullorum]
MSKSINKKELKKQCIEFRTVASRVLTSDFQVFNANLKRLINFIDSIEIIRQYIDSCICQYNELKIADDVEEVCTNYGCIFEDYIEEEKEVAYIYQILKYIVDNNIDCRAYIKSYSSSSKYQDKLKSFCDNVVEPLVNHIDVNYERIFIEMGMDEETKYTIVNNGGQVNIAQDNANITATQINYNKLNELVANIKQKVDDIKDEELKQEIIDNTEGIQEELEKKEIKKGRVKSFIASLQTKLPSIGSMIEISAAITELITFAQQYIK